MAPSLATIIIIIRVVALASISLVVYAQQLAVVETRVSRNRSTTIEVVAQPPSSPYSYVSVEGPQGLQSVLSHLNLTGSEVLTRHQGLWDTGYWRALVTGIARGEGSDPLVFRQIKDNAMILPTGLTIREYTRSLVATMGPPLGEEEAYRIEEALQVIEVYTPRLPHAEPQHIIFTSTLLLRLIARKHGYKRYLQLGCLLAANTFKAMREASLEVAIGVDPTGGGGATHYMDYDRFFSINNQKFDLIFIKLAHGEKEVLTMIRQALSILSKGGTIIVHNTMPRSETSQALDEDGLPRSFYLAHFQGLAPLHAPWLGEAWKAVIRLRARPDLDVVVVDIDDGCAVIRARPNRKRLPDRYWTMDLDYKQHLRGREVHMLLLSTIPETVRWLEEEDGHYREGSGYKSQISHKPSDTVERIAADGLAPMTRALQTERSWPLLDDGVGVVSSRYESHLRRLRSSGRDITMMEVGMARGRSIGMWQDLFGREKLRHYIGVDVDPAFKKLTSPGVVILTGDPGDAGWWTRIKDQVPMVDLLVMSGGHTMEQQALTFQSMWSHIKEGGMFIVDDTLTTYWTDQFGSSSGSSHPPPSMTTTTKKRAIVVARYRESMEWIPEVWRESCFVYNKGPPLESGTMFAHYETLPNRGREGHTYLYYIIQHYHHLPDLAVFTQANPFDHIPDFLERVEAVDKDEEGGSKPFFFTAWGHLVVPVVNMSPPYLPPLKPYLEAYYDQLIGCCPRAHEFEFTSGSLFVLSREAILQHPREYYQRLLDRLASQVNPPEGHVLERLWRLIFDGTYRNQVRRRTYQQSPPVVDACYQMEQHASSIQAMHLMTIPWSWRSILQV